MTSRKAKAGKGAGEKRTANGDKNKKNRKKKSGRNKNDIMECSKNKN